MNDCFGSVGHGMDSDANIASLTWRVTPDMVCILDREGRFFAVNPAWQATLGWPRTEMVGREWLDFVHPDDVARSIATFGILQSGKPVLRFENRYRTKVDVHRWLSWVAVPEGDRFYCTVRDVTEDKEKAATIADQREEAELREQFLAVLGHDLRNPVSALSAGVRLLSRRVEDEESREILHHMDGSVSRMTELIENMMDLARVRLGGGISIERTSEANLAESLLQVIDEIRLVSPDHEFRTTMEITQPVSCDIPRILQLVSNLLANAVTHGAPSEPIQIDARTCGGRFRLTVSNKGLPIPDAARDKLFQPFFRGQVRESQQGLGLGLYIASEIAKAHGGALVASSDCAETSFTLDIPA
jgi:phosphoserine phosphatase RsbU/P